MSVAILIEFKESSREELYLPLATQGAYSSEWVPASKELGLQWLPLFLTGTSVDVEDLPAVVEELRCLRTALADAPRQASTVERLDFILERLSAVDTHEIAGIFIG
ncbi:hypothetical protein [Stigmatella aurantiaca]|uniref:Conserved uncharacterized protein n=1 Tax=Stigmatella aurantiaca (strain DW4/3-1) TaxID=378806 RepID=E3FEH9_STIAD|nr:hypothetical protein [Stigmatella aurantiaca]ADO75135.1 conserved uncharacterized protein [Stigmatella aurantiaca DW4/3-1]